MRFSTVAGGRDSSEAIRDPRGFAVKFYTEDGNWDLVGNNLGVFFIRDAIKFPDFIHSQKPDPVSFERQVPNRVFDFISQSPESMHMVTLVFGPRGIPASYRTMQGFGVNTYKWVNEAGETKLVKYHWLPKQGVKSWTEADAGVMQGRELGCHTKDLYEAIERGDYPEWELNVQMMDDHDHPELDWDPLDDTKTWPEQDFPLTPIGNDGAQPDDARTSSPRTSRSRSAPACWSTGSTSPTTRCSSGARSPTPTRSATASGRTTSSCRSTSPRTGRRRPTSATRRWPTTSTRPARTRASTTSRRSPAAWARRRSPRTPRWARRSRGRLTRARIPRTDDYRQAGERYQLSEQWEKDDLVGNLTTLLGECDRPIQERMVWHLLLCDDELGQRVGDGLGISADDVRSLKPVPTQGWGEEEQRRLDNLGNNGPRDVEGLVMTHCVPNEHVAIADEPVTAS